MRLRTRPPLLTYLLTCAIDIIIPLTKEKAERIFAFPLFLTLPNDAEGYTVFMPLPRKGSRPQGRTKAAFPC